MCRSTATRQYRSGNRNCALYSGICAPYVGKPHLLHSESSGFLLLRPKRGPRKLGNSESGIWGSIWGSLGLGPKRGPRKLGNSESGICGTVSWNLHTRILGIWKWRRSILESAHMESRNLDTGNSMVATADPQRGLGNSETRKLEFAKEYPVICTLGNMESGIWGPSADPQ